MERAHLERIFIFGNSGSGKSWLAERLARVLAKPVHGLDAMRWKQGTSGVPRDNVDVAKDVDLISRNPSWIMEGVYGWLAQVALPRATCLIWTDLPVEECVANVRARGRQGGEDNEGFVRTLSWTEHYFTRTNSSCYLAHERLFDSFQSRRARLSSRKDFAKYLAESGGSAQD